MSSCTSELLNRSVALLLVICIAGCATRIRTTNVTLPNTQNPPDGPSVKITEVIDSRRQVVEEWAAQKTGDPDIAARTLGTLHRDLGLLVLPEGRTVAQVVEEAIVRGLRLAGFRVVNEGDPEYDAAAPLRVEIVDFWSWKETWGLTDMGSYFGAIIRLSGPREPFKEPSKPLPFLEPGVDVVLEVDASIKAAIIDWSSVRLAFRKGVRKLVDAVANLSVHDRPVEAE